MRYNAEKKKIGKYYSTPIYSFRCKCHLCSGWFEIQTDPKNTRYIVTEGARAQVQDWDPEENGGHPVIDYNNKKEGEEDGANAFEKFEKASTSKKRALTNAERLAELEDHNDERWTDPYTLNKNLRKALREDKGKMRESRAQDDELAARYGLGENVRLDLVRGAEDRVDGESRATWLSTGDKNSSKQEMEDRLEWERAQAELTLREASSSKRRRIAHGESTHSAQTEMSAAKSTDRRDTSAHAAIRASSSARKMSSSSPATSAASRLKNQLAAAAARKANPFQAFGASTSIGSPAASSSVARLVVKGGR